MNFIKKMFRTKRYLVKYLLCFLAIIILGVLYYLNTSNKDNVISVGGEVYTNEESSSYESVTDMATDALESGLGKKDMYYIYVCGAVNVPGVYRCAQGSRIYELIEKAGGFCENADKDYLNLVEEVEDGIKIYVPQKGENVDVDGTSVTLVNINTATLEQLMTLPGIGESRAKDIISYRKKNGNFKSIEDIKKVSGIKDAAYEKIKDLISV